MGCGARTIHSAPVTWLPPNSTAIVRPAGLAARRARPEPRPARPTHTCAAPTTTADPRVHGCRAPGGGLLCDEAVRLHGRGAPRGREPGGASHGRAAATPVRPWRCRTVVRPGACRGARSSARGLSWGGGRAGGMSPPAHLAAWVSSLAESLVSAEREWSHMALWVLVYVNEVMTAAAG